MLQLLDDSLEAMFRAAMPPSPSEVDFSFERPDATWRTALTKPTVNFHLWEIVGVSAESQVGWQEVEENGRIVRRPPLPRVAFRYHVSVWTSEARDQHQLLGALLIAALRSPTIPLEHLHPALRDARPLPTMKLNGGETAAPGEVWSGLQHGITASLDLTVVLSVDAVRLGEVGPPTTALELKVADMGEEGRRSATKEAAGRVDDPDAVGALVRSPRGRSTVGPDGRFAVPAEPGDTVVVETARPLAGVVPEHGAVELS